jgi:hypothetical protein
MKQESVNMHILDGKTKAVTEYWQRMDTAYLGNN